MGHMIASHVTRAVGHVVTNHVTRVEGHMATIRVEGHVIGSSDELFLRPPR